jgi:hypothetical protein
MLHETNQYILTKVSLCLRMSTWRRVLRYILEKTSMELDTYLLPRFCINLILTFVEPRFTDSHHSKCVCRDVQEFQCFSQTLWWFVNGFCAKDMSRFSNRPRIMYQLNVRRYR